MDPQSKAYLDAHERQLLRRVRRYSGLVPLALPYDAIAEKAATDGIAIEAVVYELVRDPESETSRDWLQMLAEDAATNTTHFFRDRLVFEHFSKVTLPSLIIANADTKKLRIWSAGCSSGQEAYSLASILHDARDQIPSWDVKVIATDLSRTKIAEAVDGQYAMSAAVWQWHSEQRGQQYRNFVYDAEQGLVSPNAALRQLVDIRQHNLLDGPDVVGECDAVFCRYVLIHMDGLAAKRVIDGFTRVLQSDGRIYFEPGACDWSSKLDLMENVAPDTSMKISCFRLSDAVLAGRPARALPKGTPTADDSKPS